MKDPAAGLSVLHVIVRAGATNSQYNEHCLPVADSRNITVCSLFPSDVTPPSTIPMFEGDGTRSGCRWALREALDAGPYDAVHVHAPASGVLTLWVYLLSMRSRRNLVFTVHNSWANFRRRNRMFLRIIVALFPLVVVCGQAAFDSMPHRLRRRYSGKLRVVPNGIDIDRIDKVLASAPTESNPRDGCTIVSLNRLIPLKDPATLLEAFVRVRRDTDRLVFLGDGPLRDELSTAVYDLGLQSVVTFRGIVERDEVYRILGEADVFVSTSGGEGLPVALLEAMACRCPVITTDIPPHREIAAVAPGIPLLPVKDSVGISLALKRMLEMTEEGRSRLGQNLRSSVSQNFSVRAMNEAYGELYLQTVKRNGSQQARPPLRPADAVAEQREPTLVQRLRRRLGLVVALSLLGGLGGFLYAEHQTAVFKGETTLLVGGPIGSAVDEDTLKSSAALATLYADMTRREAVLGPVTERGLAEDWRELRDDVHPQTGDKNPQLVQIQVYAGSEEKARQLASAIAEQLQRITNAGAANPKREFVDTQLGLLQDDITAMSGKLQQAEERLAQQPPPADRDTLEASTTELRSRLAQLQQTYSDLNAQSGSPDVGRTTVLDEAWAARSPLRPTPIVLILAGAAVGFALAVGWIHLFDRGRARRSGTGPGRGPSLNPVDDTEPPWDVTPPRKAGT